MTGVADEIAGMLSRLGSGPVFVHSDPFRAARLAPPVRSREALIDSHLDLLKASTRDRELWMPAFNYDFPKTQVFDLSNDVAQLGPIPERFRAKRAGWRTPIPIFSASGTGAAPAIDWGDNADPFGARSVFAQLAHADGVILYYGDTFHYNTLVHYAERLMGGPLYRYDKLFPGVVVDEDGTRRDGSLNYHVRPLGTGLEYDWPALLERAVESGACTRLETHYEILGASAQLLTDFFVDEMQRDPLALLDAATRQWVEPRLDAVGRRFVISDFEPAHS